LPGTLLLEAAGRAGLAIDTPCGGKGTCGKCRVRFESSPPEPNAAERRALGAVDIRDGWRLACQSRPTADAVVTIPAGSLLSGGIQIRTDGDSEGVLCCEDSPVRRVAGERNLTAAFDIGTTTLVVSLVDLDACREVAIASAMNPQVRFGDDVIGRIQAACEGRGEDLHKTIIEEVSTLIDTVCEQVGAPRDAVRAVSFAGNTAMQQLLAGLDVTGLSALPFAPATLEPLSMAAVKLGLDLAPQAEAYCMPVIGGFVGGDIVAGLLATDLAGREGPGLMIDVGTNGEIVLADGETLLAASAAAGPAFEGARLTCGMRATPGAIEKVILDEEVRLSVIGGVAPSGLCGSAAIDITAELLNIGAIESTGRLLTGEEVPETVSPAVRSRLVQGDSGAELVLAEAPMRVVFTQKDIRELQLAVGAIRAGVSMLIDQAGHTPEQLRHVLVAGGFGSFIRRNHAQRIGLIPAEVPHDRVRYVGNVSLTGAKAVLVNRRARQRAERLARQCEHVDLSADPMFQMIFAESMIFPEGR
jgi:uncharacterized 2Fe-2S/4Fe-4S cluster protein (DUF4445 family)